MWDFQRMGFAALVGLLGTACGGTDGSTSIGAGAAQDGSGGAAMAADAGGSTGGAATVCVPGASSACVGPAGCQGGQVCAADGSGYGACDCGTAAGTGGATGSGGTTGSGGAIAAGGSTSLVTTGADGRQWLCGTQYSLANGGRTPTACWCYPDGIANPCGNVSADECDLGPCKITECCFSGPGRCLCGPSNALNNCVPTAPNVVVPSCP